MQVKIFKYNFLSSPWSKFGNLSAYCEDKFLNFSKLTQLLSVGHFQRSQEAYKVKNKTGHFILPPLYTDFEQREQVLVSKIKKKPLQGIALTQFSPLVL